MIELLNKFALSIAPPDPGCEYIWEPDPVWGRVPAGQACGASSLTYIVVGVVIGIIFLSVYLTVRKNKRKK